MWALEFSRRNGVSEVMSNEIEEKAKQVIRVWNEQSGRVFESMGHDNPRAESIDKAINELDRALYRRAFQNSQYPGNMNL